MERGDVIEVDLRNPPGGAGHEQAGKRPVVVISDADSEPDNPLMIIVPFTSDHPAKRRFPHVLPISSSTQNGLLVASLLLAFQIRALDKRRMVKIIGKLETNYMTQLEQSLRELMRL